MEHCTFCALVPFKMNKVFVVFVAITYFAYVSGQYKCFQDDLTIFEYQGTNFTCEEGQFCKSLPPSEKFQPCVNIADECGAKFKCSNPDDEKEVTIQVAGNEQKLTCRGNTVCNSKPKKNCDPCVPKICPKDVFKCKDNKHVILNGIKDPIKCPGDKVCNKEYDYPCNACISPDGI